MKLPQPPPSYEELLQKLTEPDVIRRVLSESRPVDAKGRYLHWDDARNRTPPDGLNHEEWWFSTSWARSAIAKTIPLRSADGRPFHFSNIDLIQEMVHRIDQKASGRILADDVFTNLRSSNRYLVSALVEEAITSSQMEGASTTRRVAKEMLATGRKPRDRSERMIANNYQGMLYAQELAQQALSPNDVLDLHRILTDETLDHPESAGRMQTPDEVRIGVYGHDGTLLHRPPPANELSDRMKVMCDFANGESHSGFIHPVVRAIIAHFCLAYDHPFEDGNGRTARALFYWSMLRDGYWLTQYLSISSILHKAPVKYARSFQLVETDDNDLTYFIIYQLEVIERAIKSLHEYLARKVAETRDIEVLVHGSPQLNHRQLLIVGDALRDPSEVFTINAQSRRNRVTYQTARTDLLSLEVLGLLTKSRVGNKFVFHSSPQLSEHLRTLGE